MIETAPLVSVIVPAYNAADFVARTLASLRDQTFTDFEVLVVDDGSRDETAQVVMAAIEGDPRFRLIRQPNGGVSAARNRGLREARGVYVANIDSDDLWRPQFLERTVEALEQAGPGTVFAFARTLWIDPDDRLLAQTNVPFPPVVGYRELLIRNPVGNGSAVLMRRSAVEAVGGWDGELVRDFGQTEDWLLLLQLSWGGAIVMVDEPLVLYRISPQSYSQALDRSARGAREVIRRCQAWGPKLARSDYWAARSLCMVWLMRRAVAAGRWGLVLRLAAHAYLRNPLWFAIKELRAPVLGALRLPFRILRRRLAGGAMGALSPSTGG